MAIFKAQSCRSRPLRLAAAVMLGGLQGLSLASPADAIEVLGWPVPALDGAAPDLSLGDDPVNGRQLCPALTRLNLAEKKSEVLLLKRVVEEFRDAKRGALWRLELGGRLFWWNGAPVKASEVADYLKRMLPELVARRGAGLWAVPPHEVKVEGDNDIVVKWQQAPVFGPFVLNDAPFFRETDDGGLKYECAGLYFPVTEGFGLTLKPAPGYRMSKPLPEVKVYKAGARPARRGERSFELRYAAALTGSPGERATASGCRDAVDVPYATMILWNTHKGPASDRTFRQLMTQLSPRGALASAGTGALAQVASSPVPRSHPGFNSSVRTRPFNIRAVSEGLGRLGYRRKTAASPRVDAKGKPLELTLLTQAKSTGLVEKVLTDTYSAVGVTVKFQPLPADGKASPEALAGADGMLATVFLDWPRVSFLGDFHSAVTDSAAFWSLRDAKLDILLDAYARSLTTPAPDFALLSQIHARLADLEPATVLLHHKACVQTGPDLKLVKGVNQNDPDWFRQLLF